MKRASPGATIDTVRAVEMARGRFILSGGSKAGLTSLKKRVLRQLCRELGLATHAVKRRMVSAIFEHVRKLSSSQTSTGSQWQRNSAMNSRGREILGDIENKSPTMADRNGRIT